MRFSPIPTPIARAYQSGGLDANGQVPCDLLRLFYHDF